MSSNTALRELVAKWRARAMDIERIAAGELPTPVLDMAKNQLWQQAEELEATLAAEPSTLTEKALAWQIPFERLHTIKQRLPENVTLDEEDIELVLLAAEPPAAPASNKVSELADRWEKDSVRLDSDDAGIWIAHSRELRMAMMADAQKFLAA